MKGCRIVVQTSDGKDLYVKRIALPILSADKFTTVTMDMTVDIYEAIIAYQQSQKNKTSFQEEFDNIHKKTRLNEMLDDIVEILNETLGTPKPNLK